MNTYHIFLNFLPANKCFSLPHFSHKIKMNITKVSFDENQKRIATIPVVVPFHATKTTLTDPDRQECSVITMCLVGSTDKPDYNVSDDGKQLIITEEVPKAFLEKKKMFSKKRQGKEESDLWQGAFLEAKDKCFEDYGLEEGDSFVFQLTIDLPIPVMKNKKHDIYRIFQLETDGVYVREFRLRGTKVFGSSTVKTKMEMFDEDSDSEDDVDNNVDDRNGQAHEYINDDDATMSNGGLYD